MKVISINHINISALKKLALVCSVVMLLVIGKDLSHSYVRSYSFYISESLLFGVFWVLFVPTLFMIKKTKRLVTSYYFPLVVSISHIIIFSALVFSISNMFYEYPFEFFKTFINTLTKYGIVCLIVYSMHLFFISKNGTVSNAPQKQLISEKIAVTYRNSAVVIDYKDIIYITSEKPYIAIITKERTYLHTSTLKRFLEEKATNNFIQIHKSTIINTDAIVSYTSRKNGDYDVLLNNQKTVRASRNYNTNFKPFFDRLTLE